MTLIFNACELWSWPTHTKVNGQSVPKIDWKPTDRRTEAIALPPTLLQSITMLHYICGRNSYHWNFKLCLRQKMAVYYTRCTINKCKQVTSCSYAAPYSYKNTIHCQLELTTSICQQFIMNKCDFHTLHDAHHANNYLILQTVSKSNNITLLFTKSLALTKDGGYGAIWHSHTGWPPRRYGTLTHPVTLSDKITVL